MKCVEIEPGIARIARSNHCMLRIVFLYRGRFTTNVIYKKQIIF